MRSRSSCDVFDELVEQWGPAAPAAVRRTMEEHASGCSRCAALLAQEDTLDRLLEERLRPPAPEKGFTRRLLERIAALPAGPALPRWTTWLEAAAAAGAGAALAIAISLPNVVKVLTALPASSVAHAPWVAGAAGVATMLWFACEALAEVRPPSR